MPDSERKPARVQIKGPQDSSSALQSATTFCGTKDFHPFTTIYLDSSTEIDLSNAKAAQEPKLTKPHICLCPPCHLGQAPCT